MTISKLNHTQVPNDILDKYLPTLSGSEFKVILVICRQTIGWHKDTDFISNSQLVKKTGLSEGSVQTAVRGLEEKELIKKSVSGKGRGIKTYYEINYSEIITPKIEPITEDNTPKITPLQMIITPKIDPTKEININKIEAQLRISRGGRAESVEKKRLTEKQRQLVRIHYFKGINYYSNNNFNRAIEEWRKVLAIDPTYEKARINIRKCFALIKR